MPKEKVNGLLNEINNYLASQNRIEPFLFLYGEDKTDGTKKILDLALTSATDISETNKILSKFVQNATRYVEGDESFKNIEEDEDLIGLFYKSMSNEDFLKTNDLSIMPQARQGITILDFARGKFKNQFFVLELNLDAAGDKKILLMRAISPSYYAKSKFSISWYNERKKITFIDNKKNLIFDEYFDVVALVDKKSQTEEGWNNEDSNSFFFILNRKRFEDLYDYLEKYNQAYDNLVANVGIIDWNHISPTLPIKRKCYSLNNFGPLTECIEKIEESLRSEEANEIKNALDIKGINYEIDGEDVKIIPSSSQNLKSLLKIMSDGLAKTCLLNRSVLGSDFEDITPQE